MASAYMSGLADELLSQDPRSQKDKDIKGRGERERERDRNLILARDARVAVELVNNDGVLHVDHHHVHELYRAHVAGTSLTSKPYNASEAQRKIKNLKFSHLPSLNPYAICRLPQHSRIQHNRRHRRNRIILSQAPNTVKTRKCKRIKFINKEK